MKLSSLSKALMVCGAILVSTGCTSMLEVGEAPTECPNAVNGGVTCTSAREIWKMTNNKKALTQDMVKNGADSDADEEVQPRAPYPGGTPEERQAIYSDYMQSRDAMAAPEPIAVRQPAKILRVLMNSWEDDFGRLHMPGYTYVEIEKRKWVVGRGATTNPARITPLSIRKQSLTEERKHNPTADNGMGIIQRQPTQQQ